MIYVTSDLHGYSLDKFKLLLQKANFSDSDFCFILGDVIDRGEDGGIKILEWLMLQPNIELLLGNHEFMLLSNTFLFDKITDETVNQIDADQLELLSDWLSNGGDPTIKALSQRPIETVNAIVEYLKDASLYETISVNGRDFFLCHSGLDNFEKSKPLNKYDFGDFVWNRPEMDDEYFDDVISVFGHTPTLLFGNQYRGKIIKTKTWIDVDTGTTAGYPPALLRLDDLQEFYLEL